MLKHGSCPVLTGACALTYFFDLSAFHFKNIAKLLILIRVCNYQIVVCPGVADRSIPPFCNCRSMFEIHTVSDAILYGMSRCSGCNSNKAVNLLGAGKGVETGMVFVCFSGQHSTLAVARCKCE